MVTLPLAGGGQVGVAAGTLADLPGPRRLGSPISAPCSGWGPVLLTWLCAVLPTPHTVVTTDSEPAG